MMETTQEEERKQWIRKMKSIVHEVAKGTTKTLCCATTKNPCMISYTRTRGTKMIFLFFLFEEERLIYNEFAGTVCEVKEEITLSAQTKEEKIKEFVKKFLI